MMWQPEQKQEVAVMLKQGMSAAIIAAVFKVSRNAVIGVVHRDKQLSLIGLRGRKFGMVGKTTATAPKPAKKRIIVEKAPSLVPDDTELFTSKSLHTVGRPMDTLEARECRWSVNNAEHGEPHLFCARETAGGKAYCSHHASLLYIPRSRRSLEALAGIAA